MATAKNTNGLKQAAERKQQQVLTRVEKAIAELQSAGLDVNFNRVANFANVPKSWLYKTETVKNKIDILRTKGKNSRLSDIALLKNQREQIEKLQQKVDTLENTVRRQKNSLMSPTENYCCYVNRLIFLLF